MVLRVSDLEADLSAAAAGLRQPRGLRRGTAAAESTQWHLVTGATYTPYRYPQPNSTNSIYSV